MNSNATEMQRERQMIGEKTSTRDEENICSNGDKGGHKECCRHHMLAECKLRHDLRPEYLGMCRRRN